MLKKHIYVLFIISMMLPQASNSQQLYKSLNNVLTGEAFEDLKFPEKLDENKNNTNQPKKKAKTKKENTEKVIKYRAKYGADGSPIPTIRPSIPTNKVIPPEAIYSQNPNRANLHLPVIQYEEDYISILFNAVAKGQTSIIRAMVKRLDNTEVRDSEGNTPLIFSALAENAASAQVLLGIDAAINATNNHNLSSLYIATTKNNEQLVKLLLEWGADVNTADANGSTPLMLTIRTRNMNIFSLLQKANADVNAKRIDGYTALHLAILNNRDEFIDQLIKAGADINAINSNGQTPLSLAIDKGNTILTKKLIALGAELQENQNLEPLYNKAKQSNNIELLKIVKTKKIKEEIAKHKEKRSESQNSNFIPKPMQKPWYKGTDKEVPKPQFSKPAL